MKNLIKHKGTISTMSTEQPAVEQPKENIQTVYKVLYRSEDDKLYSFYRKYLSSREVAYYNGKILLEYKKDEKTYPCIKKSGLYCFSDFDHARYFINSSTCRLETWEAKADVWLVDPSRSEFGSVPDIIDFWKTFRKRIADKDSCSIIEYLTPRGTVLCKWVELTKRIEWKRTFKIESGKVATT